MGYVTERTVSLSQMNQTGEGPEHQDRWSQGQIQETQTEESTHVCWRHAEGPAGLQAHGQHGPEGQPEAGQEGSERGGESDVFIQIF